jgi:hypothetical protein
LKLEPEHHLVAGSLVIDLLAIRKRGGSPIRHPIAEMFRGYNIIEYKSPEDSFSINDFYKVYAYACLYKTLEKVDIGDLTLSVILTGYPRELMRHLRQVRGYAVERRHPGVHEIKGDILPIQVIESRRLEGDENFWLRNLGCDLTVGELNEVLRMLREKGMGYNLNAYLATVLKANRTVVEANMEAVSPEWERIIEKIGWGAKWRAEAREEGRAEARAEGEKLKAQAIARNALKMNIPIPEISILTGLSREEIEVEVERLRASAVLPQG